MRLRHIPILVTMSLWALVHIVDAQQPVFPVTLDSAGAVIMGEEGILQVGEFIRSDHLERIYYLQTLLPDAVFRNGMLLPGSHFIQLDVPGGMLLAVDSLIAERVAVTGTAGAVVLLEGWSRGLRLISIKRIAHFTGCNGAC